MKHSIQYFIHAGVVLLLTISYSEAYVHKHKSYHAKIPLAHSHHNLLKLRNLNETDSNNEELPSKDYHGIKKETSKCEFPSDAGLVAVTPKAKNAGWAMSPDEQCSPGSYCPYACPSGKVMAQWNPEAKAYTYPQSMDGGLYCDHDGKVKKPFPEKPYCVSGTGGVEAHNKIGMGVSFCQTVLPGNEAMLIPTHVEESTELAVPGTNYWCNTAAHYYINPPGVGVEDACIWGDGTKPVGNWSPYVAGANTDEFGKTFVKVGWNPIYTGSSLSGTPPEFGVRIVCEKGDCNGTPCSIDPSTDGVGGVTSADKANGAGGASFCVVTVPKGSKANIEDDDHKDKDHKDKDPKDDDHKDKDHKDKDPKDDDHKDKDHKDKDPKDDDHKDKDHKDNVEDPKDDNRKEIEDVSGSLSLDDTSPLGEKTPTSIPRLSPNMEKLPADFPISESQPVDSYQGETLTPFLKSGNGEETGTSATSDKEMDQVNTESEASNETSSFDSNVNSFSEQLVQEPSDPPSNSHRADQNQATSKVPSALFEMGSDEPSMTPIGLKQTDKTESSSEKTSSSISLKTSSHTFLTTLCLFLLTLIHS
ncbi:putative secreted beta-glucosidase adg3 [Golovinomyces cichoracearum]|uniref:Putative secreted beta-glucosidase adg3 n=1 Tax=Golovinomyces cichoracearum TaxID=62708 RepID=A0A420I907_9PEZI|nr:putative secreted beta-glucosidase adg3 [Golovinomyces cichoracearum]